MRWEKRLRKPKAEGGATICEKHDFIAEHFGDPDMSWEVDQVISQAKDDGERMEARIHELREEVTDLNDAWQEMKTDRDRLQAERDALRAEVERLRQGQAVEVPELPGLSEEQADEIASMFGIETNRYTVWRIWGIAQSRVTKLRPVPSADVVAVPREDPSENEWIGPGIGHLVAANFPPSGCVECVLKHGCNDARGMRCTPRERKDGRRIIWVEPNSAAAKYDALRSSTNHDSKETP